MPTGETRQFVSFSFYKAQPEWLLLPDAEKDAARREFAGVVEAFGERVMTLPYTTVGMRGDTDLLLWRISHELEALQEMSTKLRGTGLGKHLATPYHYLAMTKRSIYVKEHVHDGQEGSRLKIVPGKGKYLFVYPFVKLREWYSKPEAERQAMMSDHIKTGHKYPTVKINTTYSFGLDDQEFVVAFESDHPDDFLDLVMELRGSPASRYTQRDWPVFTCISKGLGESLEAIG